MLSYALSHRHLKTIKDNILTVSAYDNFYPISFFKNGAMDGVEVRLMRLYAEACGVDVHFDRVKKWDGIWEKPRLGESDVSIGGIGVLDLRTHPETEWTMPYYYVNRSYIVMKKPKKFANEVAVTIGSTGHLDAEMRSGEIMNALTPSTGYESDMKKLRKGTIRGIMYGDQVSKSIIVKERKRTKKNDLRMYEWSMVPTALPPDGETFCFPTRLGSGVAVSLTAFLTSVADNGVLSKLCREFDLTYPAPVPSTKYTLGSVFNSKKIKKNPSLKKILAAAPTDYLVEGMKDAAGHLKSLLEPNEFGKMRLARLEAALKRSDVVDHGVIIGNVESVLSNIARRITDGGELFDFVKFTNSEGKSPLVHYRDGVCTINTEEQMRRIRANCNNQNAFVQENLKLGETVARTIISFES